MDEGLDAFVKNGIGGIALLQAVTNALPIMFNTKDRQSRYLFMNRFQAELYGVTPEAAVGRTAAELLGASYGSYTRSIDQDVIQSGNASPFFEEAYAGVDGIMRHWLTCKVPWRDAAGDVAGVATTAFDISERKALEVALAQERDRAAQASRSRGFFLASMSHEIRTPLNGVLGMLELLGITEQTPQQRRYVAMATQAGRSLLGVVNQVLDLSRIDAGGMALTPKPFAVAAMIDRAFATIAAAAQAKGLRLRWTTAAAVPEWLEGDSDRLGQVLVNLVGNAVRFTDAGVIAVAVSLARDDAAGVLLRFEVQDTGQGIPPAERARIFDAFVQADGARQPGHGGTGLGLAIARQICTAMDGEIGVEEAPGGGHCSGSPRG